MHFQNVAKSKFGIKYDRSDGSTRSSDSFCLARWPTGSELSKLSWLKTCCCRLETREKRMRKKTESKTSARSWRRHFGVEKKKPGSIRTHCAARATPCSSGVSRKKSGLVLRLHVRQRQAHAKSVICAERRDKQSRVFEKRNLTNLVRSRTIRVRML